jgi:hypothetical protein
MISPALPWFYFSQKDLALLDHPLSVRSDLFTSSRIAAALF